MKTKSIRIISGPSMIAWILTSRTVGAHCADMYAAVRLAAKGHGLHGVFYASYSSFCEILTTGDLELSFGLKLTNRLLLPWKTFIQILFLTPFCFRVRRPWRKKTNKKRSSN